jgi:dienelactone hydrolase
VLQEASTIFTQASCPALDSLKTKFLEIHQEISDRIRAIQAKFLPRIDLERPVCIRAMAKEMFIYNLVFAEYHNTENDNWLILLGAVHESCFINYTYEVHYLDLLTGNILAKDIVPRNNQKYDFRCFEGVDNNTIIPLAIYQPPKSERKSPVAIYMHGGPAAVNNPGHKNPQFSALARLGYTIIAPNYRGSALRPEFEDLLEGNLNHMPLEDMQATLKYIKSRNDLDVTKILLTGISYGTYLISIVLDQISDQLAGVLLHTGFYGNPSPSPFDHLKGINPKLPILFASGPKDFGNTGLDWSIKYIRAIKDVSHNFKYCLVENGGHHLLSLVHPEITPFPLDMKAPLKLDDMIQYTSSRFNSEAFMEYVYHVVELFEGIANGINPSTVTDGYERNPKGIDLIHKIHLGQKIKSLQKISQTTLQKAPDLVNAPYSPSEAHLAIVCGKAINLEKQISNFLLHYDTVKGGIRDAFIKGYQSDKEVQSIEINRKFSQDVHIHQLICQIITKELENKGCYVLYHGASPASGFLYDVSTSLKRLFSIHAKNEDPQYSVKFLRALNDAFIKYISSAHLASQMREIEHKYPSALFNYLPGFQDVAISAQWFLFGSYKYWFNSTFFRYFLKGTSAESVDIGKILRSFFESIGLTKDLDQLIKSYCEVFYEYINPADGRLLQICVSPTIIDEVAYVAEAGGEPLLLKMDDNSSSTCAPSKIISLAMKDPDAFEAKLKSNRDAFKNQSTVDKEEFTKEEKGLSYTNSVEARLLMTPEYMDDPEKIQIVSYHTKPVKKGYESQIDEINAKFLASWLEASPKLGPGMDYITPPAVKLQNYITNVQRAPYTLYDRLSCSNWKATEEWIKSHPKEVFSPIDTEGHSILYQLLSDHKFQVAHKFLLIVENLGLPILKLINGKDLTGYPLIYDLLLEENFEGVDFLIAHKANLRLSVGNDSMVINLLRKKKYSIAYRFAKKKWVILLIFLQIF